MRSYVKYIGVLDKVEKVHFVEFTSGVNVITGKSSTGKSAIIEIFDYCFGSSEFTIPSGVITKSAAIYFMVMAIKDTFIVIGRSPDNRKVFLKEETVLPNINTITSAYFEDKFYSSDFNVELGHYFGLDIKDVEEDSETSFYRGRKKGRPSIRNAVPYLLQHQNLIANKHSLFYRFDQKEKREQTIDQFKIFSGFVTQEYYILKQQLAEKEKELKKLSAQNDSIIEQKKFNTARIKELLDEYETITGNKLFQDEEYLISINPGAYLEKLDKIEIKANYESDKSIIELKEQKEILNSLFAKKRNISAKLNDISLSVDYVNKYREDLNKFIEEDGANIHLSECPFCNTTHENILTEANQLEDAINWLNGELQKSPYLLDSFESDKQEKEKELILIEAEIKIVKDKIEKLNKITEGLAVNKGLEIQAQKIKLKIENLLESLLQKDFKDLERNIKITKLQIKELSDRIKNDFDVAAKIKAAENYINSTMKKLGNSFEFEDSYKPINLKFSLESFDLWHEKKDEKIYLRSMGSGANWLYSHVTLFLAIQKYFASLTDSRIPTVLFLDQPSQVYFPTAINDDETSFNAKELKKKEGKISGLGEDEQNKKIDEDLNSVTNLFNQLVKFVAITKEETGIEPQIIVTDHADNLQLSDGVDFESLVNKRRWRTRGFIDPVPDLDSDKD